MAIGATVFVAKAMSPEGLSKYIPVMLDRRVLYAGIRAGVIRECFVIKDALAVTIELDELALGLVCEFDFRDTGIHSDENIVAVVDRFVLRPEIS